MTSGVTTAPPSTAHRTQVCTSLGAPNEVSVCLLRRRNAFHEAPGQLFPHLRAVKQVRNNLSMSCTYFKVAFNAAEQFTSMSSICEGLVPWNRIENKSNPLFRAFKLMSQSINSRLSSSMNTMHASGLAVLQGLSTLCLHLDQNLLEFPLVETANVVHGILDDAHCVVRFHRLTTSG